MERIALFSATYQQILDEENVALRAGVIAGGGALGFLIGALRGRAFKKIFYTTIGVGATAAACYPEEAKVLAGEAEAEGMRAGQIAYNFVFGGKNVKNKLNRCFKCFSFNQCFSATR